MFQSEKGINGWFFYSYPRGQGKNRLKEISFFLFSLQEHVKSPSVSFFEKVSDRLHVLGIFLQQLCDLGVFGCGFLGHFALCRAEGEGEHMIKWGVCVSV